MRILPVAFYIKDFDLDKQFKIIHKVSSITHGHPRSKIACGYYVQFIIQLLEDKEPKEAYNRTNEIILDYYSFEPFKSELKYYDRILNSDISKLKEEEISSSGYVVSSLEASLWCFLNSKNYKECVLKAVNLGNDTDTIGAISGGMAGVFFGFKDIPEKWLKSLARYEDIYKLIGRFADSFNIFK